MNDRMAGLLIGEVAQRGDISAATIRYYEELGVLPRPPRSSAEYRRYSEQTIEELKFIRKAQALGFSLDEIGGILKLARSGKAACAHVLSLAHQHLASVEERIRQLQHFRDQLAAEIAKWNGADTPTCRGLCQIFASANTDLDTPNVPTSLTARNRVRWHLEQPTTATTCEFP